MLLLSHPDTVIGNILEKPFPSRFEKLLVEVEHTYRKGPNPKCVAQWVFTYGYLHPQPLPATPYHGHPLPRFLMLR